MIPDSQLEKLLLSSKEYLATKFTSPYTYVINNEDQSLYYFGDTHSHDPQNNEFIELVKFWEEFKKSRLSKKIVFIEGGLRPLGETFEEAIIKYGTAGAATYLASSSKIKVVSPDIHDAEYRNQILEKYSKDEIQYYFFARMVSSWNRKKGNGINFENYINYSLESDQKYSGWSDYDFSLSHMKRLHKKLFQLEFNENDSEFFHSICNPHLSGRINEIAQAISRKRDLNIFKNIISEWNNGFSLFCVFGTGHAIVQERALNEFMNN